MKLRFITITGVIGMLFFLVSCVSYLPISQPSGAALTLKMDRSDYTVMGVGEGSATVKYFLGIPIEGEDTYKKAVEEAVKSRGGDLLIQASADLYTTGFPFRFIPIYEEQTITVTGVVVKLK